MNGKDTTKKAVERKKTTTPTPKPKLVGKCTMNAKARKIEINKTDDSEDIKELKEAMAKTISSNHRLRISLYKCGVSYGRMVESSMRVFEWFTFGFVNLANLAVYTFGWWRGLSVIVTLLWLVAIIGFDMFTNKKVEKDISKQIKDLEKLRETELKEWEE